MTIMSINPADGSPLQRFEPMQPEALAECLDQAGRAAAAWGRQPLAARTDLLLRLAALLRQRRQQLATLMTREMGKLIGEAEAEIDKCALACEHYAEQAGAYLQDEIIASDASRSLVACQPLGAILAVMPWNFPFGSYFAARHRRLRPAIRYCSSMPPTCLDARSPLPHCSAMRKRRKVCFRRC